METDSGEQDGSSAVWRGERKVLMMNVSFEEWLSEVRSALESINMPMDDWQKSWQFDFPNEFGAGTTANDAALKANRFWWHQQNKAVNQECQKRRDCWLPRHHQGECQPWR